jgi:ATP-dependent exoDNAse (exonuclease V) beta subunit
LLGETVAEEDAEELRIAFVALTRARRYCALALPDDSGDAVVAAFERVGFVIAA